MKSLLIAGVLLLAGCTQCAGWCPVPFEHKDDATKETDDGSE